MNHLSFDLVKGFQASISDLKDSSKAWRAILWAFQNHIFSVSDEEIV